MHAAVSQKLNKNADPVLGASFLLNLEDVPASQQAKVRAAAYLEAFSAPLPG